MASASAAVLWTTVLCGILIVSGTLNPTAQGVRALDAPTKLSVVFENQYTAVLFWEFTEPKDTNLDDIEFSLSLFGEKGRLEEFKLKAGRRPFHHKFKYLTPNSEYSVKLWASSLELGSSPLTTMFFTTMEGDWPTPFLTNVSARRTQEAMQYTVSWDLSSRPVELYHFDIVLCFLECETMRTRPSESHITFPISFYTEFSLNVTAVYNAGVGLKMKRTSSVYHSKSEMGPPSRVTNVTNILQKGNMFEIDWLPPDPPNGPLSYYEVLVYDPKDFDDASEVEVHSGTSATLLAPQLGGGVYKIQITAVNVDPHGVEYYSRKSVFSHERVLPSGSPRIRILDREWNYTHFRIIAEHPQEHLRFDVYSEKPTYGIFNRPDEYIIYGLNPFETFEMDVRTCYATRNLRIHTCAYFTHFNLTSNVKAPSEVRDLEIAFISKTRVSASWNPPLFPNGPNHGYLINATMGIEGVEDVTSQYNEGEPLLFHLPGHITQVEFEKPKEWRSITVSVSAVNHHLDDSTLEYVGEQVTESLRKPGFRSKTQFFLTLAYFFLAFFLMSWAIYGMAVVLLEVTFSARPELNELDLIQGVPDAPRGNQLDVDLLQGVPDRQRDD